MDADLGITYLPEMAVSSGLLEHTRVKTRALSAQNFRTIGLAWRQGSAREAEFEMFGRFLSEHR